MSPNRHERRPVLVWFRNDLRLSDQPALHAAVQTGDPVVCLYVHDEDSEGLRPFGGASKWWLHHSLTSLADGLSSIGGRLDVHRGAAATVVPDVARTAGVSACFWCRRYGAAEQAVDGEVESELRARGVSVETSSGGLLHDPADVRSKAGGAFRVFTPYHRAALALGPPGTPLPAPRSLKGAPPLAGRPSTAPIAGLNLLPTRPDWAAGLRATWTPGEPGAKRLLDAFLHRGLAGYGEDRNRPAVLATSSLSPHLRFGEVSPRQVLVSARHAAAHGTSPESEVDKFASELIWRDFAYSLLVDHPDLATHAVQPLFAAFPYRVAAGSDLTAWQTGRTGYPMVDAGMRQLWQTGFMHNRVRMIAASFLVKHLLIDWRIGERWFWDTLCDADPASNAMNWQWVAGSGVDPSPYFRIFNPTTQGRRFDPDGDYIRRLVPELQRMPSRWIHEPEQAPGAVLEEAGVTLGRTYPHPIVDHDDARRRALAALAEARRQRPRTTAAQ